MDVMNCHFLTLCANFKLLTGFNLSLFCVENMYCFESIFSTVPWNNLVPDIKGFMQLFFKTYNQTHKNKKQTTNLNHF